MFHSLLWVSFLSFSFHSLAPRKGRSIVTSTVNQTSKGVLNFLYENVYDIAFFC